MLKPDAFSGDNGPSFFGYAFNTATYVVHHPEFGWVAFGGNLRTNRTIIRVKPVDSARSRVYVASLGLWLTLDAGAFESVEMNAKTGVVRLGLAPAASCLHAARLRVERTAKIVGARSYVPTALLKQERGAYVVPLEKETTWVELRPLR
jgi:Family of unknown function (DUF5695)